VTHPSENDLVIYAFDPAAAEGRERIEAHLQAGCPECQATVDFSRSLDDDLSDPDVWERSAGSATLAALRTRAAEIAREDEQAGALLRNVIRKPAAAARTNWKQKQYRSGGVVRQLSTRAHEVCAGRPLDALIFADAAATVADLLSDDAYVAGGVFELRGTAWKERANALRLLGRLEEAHAALDRAEGAFRLLTSPAHGLAAIDFIRAAVFFDQQRYDEASVFAERAEKAHEHLGNDDGRMRALFLKANISYERGQVRSATAAFHELLAWGEALNDTYWTAAGAQGLGNCYLDNGDPATAREHLSRALQLFLRLEMDAERARTEWGLARVLLHIGRQSEAIRRLLDVSAMFERLGMATCAALTGVDAAEGLLALDRRADIVPLAERLFAVFTEAGMLTAALTAIAFLKEAAARGDLTSREVAHVRKFLLRVERHPQLLFEPPPDFR
jgi:tetratricopeptide (TPR) repeat protein